ncbi:universal stress protein [uncultured Clostridium sp.]|uniref:universal stress protein n=1 Tax=uncultured Clostridium sp. TaxID=59620 RepID=UPI00262410A1|nr:universal stress protein [uncultured Clostridium sp.]
MNKRRALIPIDGSEKSLISLQYLKDLYDPNKVEVVLLHVREIVFMDGMAVTEEIKEAEEIGTRVLNEAADIIKEFDSTSELSFGYAADEILAYVEDKNIDLILMAKNTKKKFAAIVGSVTAQVAKKTKCILVIIPEKN